MFFEFPEGKKSHKSAWGLSTEEKKSGKKLTLLTQTEKEERSPATVGQQ